MKLFNIGFGNLINTERIVAIVSPDSAPIKRMIKESKDNGTLIDATQGRQTKAVIITDCNRIILTYLSLEQIEEKL